jgi:hypothetical protein
MRGLFISAFIVVGITFGELSSFAVKEQYTNYIAAFEIPATENFSSIDSAGPLLIDVVFQPSSTKPHDEVSYLYNSYNATYLKRSNEAHHIKATIYFSDNKQLMGTMLKFVNTAILERNYLLQQLYINEIWKRNAEWGTDEYNDRYIVNLSYSYSIGPDTSLVAGFIRDQKLKESKATNIVGLGIHHQLTPQTVLALGTGANIHKDSPDFRVMLAFNFSF